MWLLAVRSVLEISLKAGLHFGPPCPGAAWRCLLVCSQCVGGNMIFTKSKNPCICFCSTSVPLVIKIHPSNYTDSWILSPGLISKIIFTNYTSDIFCLAFFLKNIYFYLLPSTHFSPLHLRYNFIHEGSYMFLPCPAIHVSMCFRVHLSPHWMPFVRDQLQQGYHLSG